LLLKSGNRLSIEEFKVQTGHKYYEPLYDFLKKMKNYIKSGEQNVVFSDFDEVVNQYFLQRN
jgi:hypothetical protein